VHSDDALPTRRASGLAEGVAGHGGCRWDISLADTFQTCLTALVVTNRLDAADAERCLATATMLANRSADRGVVPMSWRRMNQAASKHRRAHWHAEREAASSPYEIEEADGARHVTEAGARVAGPFASNAEAWSWIDRHSVARRYGAG